MTKAKKQTAPSMATLIFAVSDLSALMREPCLSVSANGRIVSWIDDTPSGHHISIALDDSGDLHAELRLDTLDPVKLYAILGYCHEHCKTVQQL